MRTRGRSLTVGTLIVAAGLSLMASGAPWLAVTISGSSVPVTGESAAPVYRPLCLALLALALVLALAGPIWRTILGTLTVIGGGALAALPAAIMLRPAGGHLAGPLAERTGLTGTEGLAQIEHVSVTGWPGVAVALGGLIALGGVYVLVGGRTWRAAGRKYESAASGTGGELDAIDSWDDLSNGGDPTRSRSDPGR